MRATITPFEECHLEGAARLLAARQARDRVQEPALPHAFESPEAVRPHVERLFRQHTTSGVVALRDGEPVGFLLAAAVLPSPTHLLAQFFPPRSISVPYHGHALAADEDASLYRELYAALAGDCVRRGYFDHFVGVLDCDHAAQEAWDSLGFGRDSTAAVREVDQPVRAAGSVEVHQLGPEGIDVILALAEALGRYHAGSPIFMPDLRETETGLRDMALALLADPGNPCFVAYRDGRPLGMNTFMPPGFLSPLQAPKSCVYLFQGVVHEEARGKGVGRALLAHSLAWARRQGYRWCTLHFAAANLSGAAFWLGNGFRPLEHRLRRHIDERIAWASA